VALDGVAGDAGDTTTLKGGGGTNKKKRPTRRIMRPMRGRKQKRRTEKKKIAWERGPYKGGSNSLWIFRLERGSTPPCDTAEESLRSGVGAGPKHIKRGTSFGKKRVRVPISLLFSRPPLPGLGVNCRWENGAGFGGVVNNGGKMNSEKFAIGSKRQTSAFSGEPFALALFLGIDSRLSDSTSRKAGASQIGRGERLLFSRAEGGGGKG